MPYLISPFAGCTKDQYSNITRWGGLLSLKMVINIMELKNIRKALLQLKWSTDFISGTWWNSED